MKNKILITGATGDLGKMVVNFLKEKTAPENIAVLVRNHKNDLVQQYKNDNIEVKIGDYSNLKDLQKAFKNIDI